MHKWSKNKMNWTMALVSTTAMILYAWLVMGNIGDQIQNRDLSKGAILDMKFGFTYQEALFTLSQLSDKGLKAYLRLLTIWDNIFPILYGWMYFTWLKIIFNKKATNTPALRWIYWFPLLPVIADWGQNFAIARMISEYSQSATLENANVHLASLISQLKWGLSYANYALLITGLFIIVWPLFSKKQTST